MSYILDALKKVERERARARYPLVDIAGAPPRARRRVWPWAVAAAVVANAAVAGVVLMRWSPEPVTGSAPTAGPAPTAAMTTPPAAPSPTPPAAVSSEGAAPAPPPPRLAPDQPPRARTTAPMPSRPARATAPAPAQTPPAQTTRPVPPHDAQVQTTTPPAPSPPVSVPVTPPAPPQTPAQPAPVPPARATAPGAPPPTALPRARVEPITPPSPSRTAATPGPATRSASELSPAFRSAIGTLKLEVLLYGDTSADRMVFINGRKYVEGQSLDGEVAVERITAEGAVLVHEGQRFLLVPVR